MTIDLLEARIEHLEARINNIEGIASPANSKQPVIKRGWRAFVGVDENNPEFEDAVRLGREWRFADSPEADSPEDEAEAQ